MESGAAPSAAAPLSSVATSLEDKRSQSYYAWSNTPEAKETPKRLEQEQVAAPHSVKSIQDYAFLDDSDKIKLYIELSGDLQTITADAINSEFGTRTLYLTITGEKFLHRLNIDRLCHDVVAEGCKAKITKARKLVISLPKKEAWQHWHALRSSGS